VNPRFSEGACDPHRRSAPGAYIDDETVIRATLVNITSSHEDDRVNSCATPEGHLRLEGHESVSDDAPK